MRLPEGQIHLATKYQTQYADVEIDDGLTLDSGLEYLKSMTDLKHKDNKEITRMIDELIKKAREKK